MNDNSPASARPDAIEIASSEYLVREIIRGVYEGRYQPGQRLQESQLTATYKLSRGPIREALNALAALGLVNLTLQRGAQIRILSLEDAVDTLLVAQTLIGLAARLAARNFRDRPSRARLEAMLETLSSYPPESDAPSFARARDSFYGAINAMGGNTELTRVLPTVHVHLIRTQFRELLHSNDPERHGDYKRIAVAILDGNERDAEASARAHFARAIATLREASSAESAA